jgi:hypothetical protein
MPAKKKQDPPPIPGPPDGLSERSLTLWHSVVPARAVSPARTAVIEEALRALDRADEARRVLADEGMVSKTESTGALHIHPLTRVERENRQLFARLWDQLGFFFFEGIDPVINSYGW